jgi:DNA-binding CsgD family transcriptional regulator
MTTETPILRQPPRHAAPLPTRARPVRREDLALLELMAGVSAAVRGDDLRVVWCNAAFVASARIEPDRLIGQSRADLICASGARERDAIDREVIGTGEPATHFQLCADRRVLTIVVPLDRASFGHDGVLVLSTAATGYCVRPDAEPVPTLATPALVGPLGQLTRRELEVLRLAGSGLSAPQIGELLFRSSKTMEHHISSIHAKLGMRSKGELVRFCVERGLHDFTSEQWDRVVLGITAGEPEATD